DQPRVTGADLATALTHGRTAVSAPVVLTLGATRYRIPRWRVATLLKLPKNGATRLRIGGPAADAFFKAKQEGVDTPARDAPVVATATGTQVPPATNGQVHDGAKTVGAVRAAAIRRATRTAGIALAPQAAARTPQDAKGSGINGLSANFTPYFRGVPN